jgi:hypothetical protein
MFKVFNVGSTTFPHIDIHKETWYSANGRTANRIDNVLIINRFKGAITDIRAPRGPDSVSDHSLLDIKFKEKLRAVSEKKCNEKRKIVDIFQNLKWEKEYAIELNNSSKYWKIWKMKIILTIILM